MTGVERDKPACGLKMQHLLNSQTAIPSQKRKSAAVRPRCSATQIATDKSEPAQESYQRPQKYAQFWSGPTREITRGCNNLLIYLLEIT